MSQVERLRRAICSLLEQQPSDERDGMLADQIARRLDAMEHDPLFGAELCFDVDELDLTG